MRVKMFPHADDIRDPQDGISRVVISYFKYLPKFGVELVNRDAKDFDLLADHAGSTGGAADVSHCHGIIWSDDGRILNPKELQTNARVIAALRAAKQVTVPSQWVGHNIARDMRFSPHVVPHGIEWEDWQPGESGGYVLWNKNRATGVCTPDGMAHLATNAPNIPFISTFAPTPPPPNVTVIGKVPHQQMKGYVQRAAVYLNTTKETFGIGILEAMAAGVPVLSVSRGGALDLVKHKETGYLAQNWDDLLDGLHYCLENRDRLGAGGREAVKAYTWDRVCEQVAGIYELAMKDDPPTVTVVIPTYNYQPVVGGAIKSVMAQAYPHFECFIVNDGSTDDTDAVVGDLIVNDGRFHYIKQENSGVANARNAGIAAGTGKYVVCLDADDAIDPAFLETCVNELEKDRQLGIAYTGLKWVRPDGVYNERGWPFQFDYDKQLQGKNQVPTCCMFRRKMWERLGGYRQRYAPEGAGAEDAEFWLRAGAYGFGARKVTDESLFVYSMGTGNVSGNRKYREPDWTAWHPWTRDYQHPFASVATPDSGYSHEVRQYDEPMISVIIPVGPGHEGVLIDALDSLEAQTFRKWEAVVINDTGGALDLTAYPYATLIETRGGMGAGYARNRGIEASKAKLFVCLDADDFLQPTFLASVIDAHKDNQDTWVYTDLFILHPNGGLENYHCEEWGAEELWRNGVASVTCLYTKAQWETVGGFDEVNNREDWDFHLRLAMAGYCGIKIASPLLTYRHATGKRREEGSIGQEAKRLRQLYPLEELEEMCRGCGRKKKTVKSTVAPPTPANWVTKEELGWPMIEYVGGNDNTLTFKGNTGRRYRFGNNAHDKIHRVHPADAPKLLHHSYFRKADEKASDNVLLNAQAAPKAKPVAPPPPPIEGTIAPTGTEITPAELEQAKELSKMIGMEESSNGKLDVNSLTVKDIQIAVRDNVYNMEELTELMNQEYDRPKPRTTILAFLNRGIRKQEAARE